jgi:hypothetical protein
MSKSRTGGRPVQRKKKKPAPLPRQAEHGSGTNPQGDRRAGIADTAQVNDNKSHPIAQYISRWDARRTSGCAVHKCENRKYNIAGNDNKIASDF